MTVLLYFCISSIINDIMIIRWDGKNAEPVMMSMADGGGSAAGQQVHT